MFNRDRFVFVSNLKDVSCDPVRPLTHLRDAYLLSERYTSAKALQLAKFAKGRKNTLFSDNGNFSRMRRIARRFEQEGEALLAMVSEEGLTTELRQKRTSLWEGVVRACEDEMASLDHGRIVARQLKMQPHAMIGLEDFAIPVLQMTGLLRPELAPRTRDVARFQRKTKVLFLKEVRGGLPQVALPDGVVPYLVLHAYHYSSAAQAGRALRGRDEVQAIAISYGATMRSNRWISKVRMGRTVVNFTEKLPEKYVVSQVLTRGALDGVRRKVRLHLLGVWSPIMVVLSALFLPRTLGVSLDSTAPLMDAGDGVIYGSRHAYLKMKRYKLAAAVLVEGTSYDSRQPFWLDFDRKYPSDWHALRRTLRVVSTSEPRSIEAALESDQVLVRRYIPYFSRMKGGRDPFFKDLRIARSGSNYWVLKEVVDAVRRRMERPAALRRWIRTECERYERVAHPKWALAVNEAAKVANINPA
jgi:hypothetical protein